MSRLKNFCIRVYRILILMLYKRPKKTSGNIALVKMNGLGDAVIALQATKAIKYHYESLGKKVFLFCLKDQEEFYKRCGDFENTISFTWKDLGEFAKFKNTVSIIRKNYFEKIINPTYSRATGADDYVVRISCADCKIGQIGDYCHRSKKDRANKRYDILVTDSNVESEILKSANFVRALGIVFQASLPDLTPFVNRLDLKPYIAVCLGASTPKRRWPIEKFAQIMQFVLEKTNYDIRIIGASQETSLYDELQMLCNNNLRIINMCGNTNMTQLIDVVGNSKYAISNDTGTGHIIGATRVKGLILLGCGNGNRFFPHIAEDGTQSELKVINLDMDCKGCNWDCKFDDNVWRCVSCIEADKVIRLIGENLIDG